MTQPVAMSSPPYDVNDASSNLAANIISAKAGNEDTKELHLGALTPPTSDKDDNRTDVHSSSDLSEIEPDQEIQVDPKLAEEPRQEEEMEEEIVPDHYYDGGRIPVFKPTLKQFRSFKEYVEKIDKYGMKSGIVKVIPPKEWRESLPQLNELVKTIRIKNPIKQEFMGTHGTYTQANIEKQRSYNLPEWKALTEEPQNQPPAKRGERRRGQEKIVRGGGSSRGRSRQAGISNAQGSAKTTRKAAGRPRRFPVTIEDDKDDDDEISEKSPRVKIATNADQAQTSVEEITTPVKEKKSRGRQPKGDTKQSVSSRRMNNQTETADYIDEAAFKDFDYRLDNIEEFTSERCQELETAYWKSLTFAQPMYAADMPGSLFPEDITSWNIAKLENLLDVLGTKVPGVNTAYLYMGMWKASFAWHLEDVDLYSINYIHFGAPKQWYSISQEDARRFEAAMRSVWPNDSKNCDQFLRHKTYLISPQLLKDRFNIQVNRLVHHEGEFVITYPYGYHSGYNLGYNCAESVNFALESWLDFGRIARKCECEADSVWVDVGEIERKLRGEPTPEYYEETDDDEDEEMHYMNELPTPPPSIKGKSMTGKKRKRDGKDKGEDNAKKKRLRIRLVRRPNRQPCVLCPNEAKHEPLLDTDDGRKAHKSCGLYLPETWISSDSDKEIVYGVSGIDKARLGLKCNFCRAKQGACFQCTTKKCIRAYHATCAAAAGVLIDEGPVPTFGEDGTEYYVTGFDLRCKFHRKRRPKTVGVDMLDNNKISCSYGRKLTVGTTVQAQLVGGDIFAGVVVENRPGELSLLIDILPEGDRVELEYKYLLIMDPVDSLRPRPSASAIPMPADMNKNSVSMDFRQDGIPQVDEIFDPSGNNKWAEFYSLNIPPQGYGVGTIQNAEQVKLHLDDPGQVYFYLGKLSTDTKPQFTDDPTSSKPVIPDDPIEVKKPKSIMVIGDCVSDNDINKPYQYKPRGLHATTSDGLGETRDASQMQGLATKSAQTAFPPDAYYSSTTLPAAFPGQYSNYTNHIRRASKENAQPRRMSVTGMLANAVPLLTDVVKPALNKGGASIVLPSLSTTSAPLTSQGQGQYIDGHESTSSARTSSDNWRAPSQVFHSYRLVLDRAPFPEITQQTPSQMISSTGTQQEQSANKSNPQKHTSSPSNNISNINNILNPTPSLSSDDNRIQLSKIDFANCTTNFATPVGNAYKNTHDMERMVDSPEHPNYSPLSESGTRMNQGL